MTPAERARQIDKQEFEAECRAIRQRAYNLLRNRPKRDPRVQACIDRGAKIGTVDGRLPPAVRDAKTYTYQGITKPLSEWSKSTGIPVGVIRSRLNNSWLIEDALSKPVRPKASDKPKDKE